MHRFIKDRLVALLHMGCLYNEKNYIIWGNTI